MAQTRLLRALRPCHSLTELSIFLRPEFRLSIEPLLSIPALRVLTLNIQDASDQSMEVVSFEETHMSVVKRLPNLRRLTLRESDERDQDEDDPHGTG